MSYTGGGGGTSRISTSADVALNNPADGQILTYDGTLAKWENQALKLPDSVQAIIVESGGTYALRNTVTNSATRPVIWRGPDAPTIGSGYAINDVDTWEPTV